MRVYSSLILILLIIFCVPIHGLENKLPKDFVNLINLEPYPEVVIVVEKSTQRAYLYQVMNHELGLEIIQGFEVSTGRVKGPKTKEGDMKTPEGFYRITEFIPEEDIPGLYGAGAFAINYPNPLDKVFLRGGNGIWLHGSDTDNIVAHDTRGCIAFLNNDLKILYQYVNIGITPVLITEEIVWWDRTEILKLGEEIVKLVSDWSYSWQDMDISTYLDFYHPQFYAPYKNMDFAQWSVYKKNVISGKKFIKVDLTHLEYLVTGGYLLVMCDQFYFADNYDDFGKKTLLWTQEGGKWQILQEDWKQNKIIEKITGNPEE
ncbi:MAG: L,D-transpeptidase family protein [Candidatus Cloacimonetes bacterium]|nr:L,D-transpeptidase family protein [Candidatus Cloacimonadota bacterium]